MLTVAKVGQRVAGGYAEYLEGKAQPAGLGDYYLKDGERVEAPGRWAGGAAVLGCDPTAAVTGAELRSLMAVRHPRTGELLRRAGVGGEMVAALDATFSAPKSVSAAWAIAEPGLRARIEAAQEQAVDRALDYALAHVAMIRQRIDHDTVIHAKPKAMIATSWRHTTARAVADRPPDPQLHSHVLLHAAIRKDGQTVAIDSRSWLTHRREVGAAYRTELARELSQLGLKIQRCTGRGQRYFELGGIPQGLIEEWSSRHQQVQIAIRQRLDDQRAALRTAIAAGEPGWIDAVERLALLEQTGQLAPGEERLMSTTTRQAKPLVTHNDLDQHWRAAAAHYGLDRASLELLRATREATPPARGAEVLDGLTEFDATFPARDARAVALERSAGASIADALEPLKQLRDRGDILVLADQTGTTRAHRGRERATVALAERLAEASVPSIPDDVVARETRRLNRELAKRGGRLSDEQREAIKLACANKPLVVIEGQAGTGKSTALLGIARSHQAVGRRVIVTSTAALAAERLARELADGGVNTQAYSTAALQAGIASGRIEVTAEVTIIHDEAALASTREQHQLIAAVETTGARLIEVGDPHQSQPVGAGGLWTHLEGVARDADGHVELARNQRAVDPADRRDQALFRQGQIEHAVRGYAARDRTHIAGEQRPAEDLALDAAHQDRQAGKNTLVIAQTSNEHLDVLNARAQAIRRQHRQLGASAFDLPGRPYALHTGDDVQVRRTLPHPDHGPIRNGTTAQITDVDPDASTLTLQLPDRGSVTLDDAQAARADLRLAYVQHPFPAQGQTTDTAHLIIADHATSEGSYVAITRAREQTHIYAAIEPEAETDRLAVLSDRMSRSEPEIPSIHTPLARETAITAEVVQARGGNERDGAGQELAAEAAANRRDEAPSLSVVRDRQALAPPEFRDHPHPLDDGIREAESPADSSEVSKDAQQRRWPRRQEPHLARLELADDHHLEHRGHDGWEP